MTGVGLAFVEGKFGEAEQLAKLILALKPDDPIGQAVVTHAEKVKKDAGFQAVSPGDAFGGGADQPKENLNTATMADLYLKQGHPEKALPIYEELLGQTPNADNLQVKVKECKSRVRIKTLGKKRSFLNNLIKRIQGNRKN
jgi:tetratricopeptide (TPR) repeat protein